MPRDQGPRRPKPRKLDLLFIQDTTGSQRPYIEASIARCKDVCYALQASKQVESADGLHLGVLAFRDHGDDYLTKDFGGFTNNVDTVVNSLSSLSTQPGRDPPEAVAAALGAAFKMEWRDDAVKVAVLITDAPPHGVEVWTRDRYRDGEPNGPDPLAVARAMAKRGITLLLIACEPTLSNDYSCAHDFYVALTRLTSGLVLPLTDTTLLAPLIVGFAFEQVKLETLVDEFTEFIMNNHQEGMSTSEISTKLHALLQSRDEAIVSPESTPVYKEPPEAEEAISIWLKAKNLVAAKKTLSSSSAITTNSRVPKEFTTPYRPWPKDPLSIKLRNMTKYKINYTYSENGVPKSGTLKPSDIEEMTFLRNTAYVFVFRVGESIIPNNRMFTKEEIWDISELFDSET